jgi:lysophospholipase L1-like esterase
MYRLIRRTAPSHEYIGPVATRCWVPDAQFNSGAFGFNMRMYHYMRASVPWIRMAPGGGWWAIGANGQGEVLPTAPFATCTMSLEYPPGVFQQAKWNGNPTLTFNGAPSIEEELCDPLVAPPEGAMFFSRKFLNVPSGGSLGYIKSSTTPGTWMDLANGDAGEISNVDMTMSGTITNDGNISPGQLTMLAIVGPTRSPSVGIFSDSRGAGWQDNVSLSPFGDAGEIARSLGPNFGYLNVGVGSDELAGVIANGGSASLLRRQMLQYCSHIVLEYGINDIVFLSTTAAQLASQLAEVIGMPGLIGKKIIVDTLLQESTSSDNWATTSGQTTFAQNPVRVAANALIRAGIPGSIGHYDPCAYGEFDFQSGTGLWIPGSITADGIHMNPTGYAALANSKQINTNFIQLPRN